MLVLFSIISNVLFLPTGPAETCMLLEPAANCCFSPPPKKKPIKTTCVHMAICSLHQVMGRGIQAALQNFLPLSCTSSFNCPEFSLLSPPKSCLKWPRRAECAGPGGRRGQPLSSPPCNEQAGKISEHRWELSGASRPKGVVGRSMGHPLSFGP